MYNSPMTRIFGICVLLGSLLATTGCATTQLMRDAATGAVIGAVAGAVLSTVDEYGYTAGRTAYPDYYGSPDYYYDDYADRYYAPRATLTLTYTVRYPACPRVAPQRVRTPYGIRLVYPPTDPRCYRSR